MKEMRNVNKIVAGNTEVAIPHGGQGETICAFICCTFDLLIRYASAGNEGCNTAKSTLRKVCTSSWITYLYLIH
jgi:hypothetical protein